MRGRWSVALVVLLLVAALTGPLVVFLGADRGQAAFGESETLGLNQLASATVVIDVGSNTVLLDTSTMAPGDRLQGQIELENNGTLPLRYALVAEFDNRGGNLLDVLAWRIWPRSSSTTCESADGPFLFEGSMTRSEVLGDPAVGADPGDRLIEPASEDVLCLEVALPIGVSDELQDATAQVDLTVLAEQATEDLQ